jgi:UDP-N-acetylmuramate dehydrogenase
MHFSEHVPLAPRTTLRIGGPARWFTEIASESEALEALRFARDRRLPVFVLGGGSNIVVSDEGFPGLVLQVALRGIEQHGDLFRAAAGEEWDGFVSHAIAQGYGGIECLAGIPGAVGGTPVQNVGAYGQEVSASIVAVRTLDLGTLAFADLAAADCGFSYRKSIFNSTQRGRYLVTRVDYRLQANASPQLLYPDLQRYFAHRDAPSLAETAVAVREIRHGKGMLLVEGEADCRSAGSFFKNPVVTRAVYDRIAATADAPVPFYPASENCVKIPAAWLLEHAGFHKGFSLGTVGISTRHTLALVNRGGATAHELLALRDRILAAVREIFAVELEPEPVWVGPERPGILAASDGI